MCVLLTKRRKRENHRFETNNGKTHSIHCSRPKPMKTLKGENHEEEQESNETHEQKKEERKAKRKPRLS